MYSFNSKKDLSLFPKVENMEMKADISLLKTLMSFRSHSKSKMERKYAKWIRKWVKKNIPEAIISTDSFGNTYVIKGDAELYPCCISHLDINSDDRVVNFTALEVGDWLMGVDLDTGLQCGLGADDANGNLIGLQLLQKLDVIKVVFTLEEEIGGNGAYALNKDFFENCSLIAQADRNAYAGPELITYTNGLQICSDEFVSTIGYLMDKYGYNEGRGSFTDVGCAAKTEKFNCVAFNSNAGYFDEHTNEEVTYIPALNIALNFLYEIFINFGHIKWPYKAENTVPQYGSWGVKNDRWVDRSYYDWEEHPIEWGKPEKEMWVNGIDYIADKDLDYEMSQECINKGVCPQCGYDNIDTDIDEMSWCSCCNSYYGIPQDVYAPHKDY